MKTHLIGAASALSLFAPIAHAGGLDRSGQSLNLIFEPGTVVQFQLSYVDPTIEGTAPAFAGTPAADSGDIGESYTNMQASAKFEINERLDFGLGLGQPYGAHTRYDPSYFLSQCAVSAECGAAALNERLSAELNTAELVGVLRYKFDNGFSVLGGLRVQEGSATVTVPAVGNYKLNSDLSTELGYLAGVAWEKPEIAARVSLVYNSAITHTMENSEYAFTGVTGNNRDLVLQDDTEVTTPQSVNLDFQTGIAPGTLLFGSVRWAEWTETVVSPTFYASQTGGTLVDYDEDVFTYTLGLGRAITDDLSLAVSLGYEKSQGGLASNLAPTDGYWSIGLGGTYSFEKAKLSGGIRYIDIGDATAEGAGGATADFSGNSAWGAGVQLTYYFD